MTAAWDRRLVGTTSRTRSHARAALSMVPLSLAACSSGTKYLGSNGGSGKSGENAECAAPVAPPEALGLDAFYEKFVDAGGIPVVSSRNTSDAALERACDAALHVLEKRADVHAHMVANEFRVVVIARSEAITDIPEYRDLYSMYPDIDWDDGYRSLGGASDRPLGSVGEENLLCLSDDLFPGEQLVVHSLAHSLRRLGILEVDPEWDARLQAAYDAAMAAGLWADTYAATDHEQYWAEGVQDWYDANAEPDRLHNEINTRAELTAYDPALAALIAEHVPDDAWRPSCPAEGP